MAAQACSILYKTKLPLLLAFNKIDVVRHEFALDWMRDYEVFNEALQRDTTYAATLSRSLSLVRLPHDSDMALTGTADPLGLEIHRQMGFLKPETGGIRECMLVIPHMGQSARLALWMLAGAQIAKCTEWRPC